MSVERSCGAGGAAPSCDTMLIEEPLEIARRRAALLRPSMRPLAVFAARIRAETGKSVPDADPCDGGTASRVLLLLERPAPAVRRVGFVSRDNATPTARNIRRFTEAAGLPRADMLIWNAVPWMDDDPSGSSRPPRPDEIRAGLLWLPPLLAVLPHLEVVVLAGRVARLAAATLQAASPHARRLLVLEMPHPSPTIVCTSPRIGQSIASAFAAAAAALREAVLREAVLREAVLREGRPIETDAD